jgi:uncharacterized protein
MEHNPASRIAEDAKRVSEISIPAKGGVSRERRGLWYGEVATLLVVVLTWQLLSVLPVHGEYQGLSWTGGGGQRSTVVFDRMTSHTIRLVDDHGGMVPVTVKIAGTPEERAAGFQRIHPEIIQKSLILFVFPQEQNVRFHMENVRAPLDIAFIGENGEILDIQEMQVNSPGTSRTYGPNRPFRYALEARAGFFKAHRISAGKGLLRLP